MTLLGFTTTPDGDCLEPAIRFAHPEDVVFELVNLGEHKICVGQYSIEEYAIITPPPEYTGDGSPIEGALTYERHYGCGMEYTLNSLLPKDLESGFYVLEDVTGCYTRGDGWMTDDDLDIYPGDLRQATLDEIAELFGVSFWDSE